MSGFLGNHRVVGLDRDSEQVGLPGDRITLAGSQRVEIWQPDGG